jgi:hypothetical protein
MWPLGLLFNSIFVNYFQQSRYLFLTSSLSCIWANDEMCFICILFTCIYTFFIHFKIIVHIRYYFLCIKSNERNLRKFLFISSPEWKLKWAFLIACCPSSSLPSVCKLLHFRPLQNHCANFNQTWHKLSLVEGDSKLFKWRGLLFSKGRW